MPKNVNRTLYTYRIMDIINSISKQKKEIDKIIEEVHQVQRDINSVGERLSRAEALADEKIYSSANVQKDAAMVQSYRHLQSLRSNFDALIT
jgi:regulator of replication initiation timing